MNEEYLTIEKARRVDMCMSEAISWLDKSIEAADTATIAATLSAYAGALEGIQDHLKDAIKKLVAKQAEMN